MQGYIVSCSTLGLLMRFSCSDAAVRPLSLLPDLRPLLDVSTSGASRAVHLGATLQSAWVVAVLRLGVQSTGEGACSVLNKFVSRETQKM